MDTTQVDPETREQLRIIALETAIEDLKTLFFDKLANLENRVETLEEARQRQIILNKELLNYKSLNTVIAEEKQKMINDVKLENKKFKWPAAMDMYGK